MDWQGWSHLVIEAPMVVALIWFALQMYNRFLDALDRRDAAYERRNAAVIEVINRIGTIMDESLRQLRIEQEEHDRFVRTNIARRTDINPPSKPRKDVRP